MASKRITHKRAREIIRPVAYAEEIKTYQQRTRDEYQLKDWLPLVPITTSGSASEDTLETVTVYEDAPKKRAIDLSDSIEPESIALQVEEPETPKAFNAAPTFKSYGW